MDKGVAVVRQGRIDGATRRYRRSNKGVSTEQQGGIDGRADTGLLIRPYRGIGPTLPWYWPEHTEALNRPHRLVDPIISKN